jgi:hypothetical protein
MLKILSGPKRKGSIREWRKIDKEELHKLYYTSDMVTLNKIRKMR